MRLRTALSSFVCASVLVVTVGVRTASATDCSTRVSPCIDDDTLWVHAGYSRFVAVGSTETVAPGQLGFGLVTTYLSRPIVFDLAAPGGSGSQAYAINDQVNASFLWAYGVSDRLELDLDVPITLAQGGAGLAPVTGGAGLQDTAIRDVRFGFAYALAARPRVLPETDPPLFGLTARVEITAPSGDRDEFAGERAGVFGPSLAADLRAGSFFAGVEGGARIRPPTELLGSRVGTQIVAKAGAGFDILPNELLSVTAEAWALPTVVAQFPPASGALVPAEWQAGVRSAPTRGGDFMVQATGGGAIPLNPDNDLTTPRFRFTLGVRWAPQARDTDRDGVPDHNDKCMLVPARTPDGCPPSASPTPTPDSSSGTTEPEPR